MGERTMWPSGTASSAGAAATGAAAAGAPAWMYCGCGAIIMGAPAMLLAMRTFSSPSVISSSAMPEASTRSMSFFSFLRSMGSPVLQVAQRVFQRQFVTVRAQTRHHADGKVGKIRMVAERFARVNVGKMNFDERDGGGRQRIAQGDAGMGVARRVDDDEVDVVARSLVDAVDQGAFVVVLKGFDLCAGRLAAADQRAVDVVERGKTVMLGLAAAQHVEVGPVQNQHLGAQTGHRFGCGSTGSLGRHGGGVCRKLG